MKILRLEEIPMVRKLNRWCEHRNEPLAEGQGGQGELRHNSKNSPVGGEDDGFGTLRSG